MKIAEFSVKNYQFTLIIFVLLLALGLNSLFNMPRGEDPEMEQPSFSIVFIYPGPKPILKKNGETKEETFILCGG